MRVHSFVFALAIVLAPFAKAYADTSYTYTGNDFTFAIGGYTTSDHLAGSFTLDIPLAPNLTDYSFTPDSATGNFLVAMLYWVSTDSAGQITAWLVTTGPDVFFGTYTEDNSQGVIDVISSCNTCYANNANDPGTWAVSTTPEPSGLALLGTGVTCLAGLVRRRFAA